MVVTFSFGNWSNFRLSRINEEFNTCGKMLILGLDVRL